MSFNRETLIQVFLYSEGVVTVNLNAKLYFWVLSVTDIISGIHRVQLLGKIKATISKILDSPSGLETVIKWNFHGRTREVLECEKPPSRNVTFRTRNSRVIQLIAQLQNSEITILYLSLPPSCPTFTFPIPKSIYVFTLPQELIVFAIQPFDNCTCMRPSLQRMKNIKEQKKKKGKRKKEKKEKEKTMGTLNLKLHFTGESSRCSNSSKTQFHAFLQRSVCIRCRQIRKFSCPAFLDKFALEAERQQ